MTDSLLAAVHRAAHGDAAAPGDPIARARQRAAAVAQVCHDAGTPSLAADLIAADATPAQVRAFIDAEISRHGSAEAVERNLLAQRVIARSVGRLNAQFDAVRGDC